MEDRTDYFKARNQKTPVMPIRLPSKSHHEELRRAANDAGMTLSAWVRNAIHKALEEQTAVTP